MPALQSEKPMQNLLPLPELTPEEMFPGAFASLRRILNPSAGKRYGRLSQAEELEMEAFSSRIRATMCLEPHKINEYRRRLRSLYEEAVRVSKKKPIRSPR